MSRRHTFLSCCALTALIVASTGCDDSAAGSSQQFDSTQADASDTTAPDATTPDTSMPDTQDDAVDTVDNIDPPITLCAADNECTPPEVCVVRVDGDGTVTQQCAPIIGPGPTGADCTDDSECQSGLCLDGACAGPCVEDADCPTTFVCEDAQVGNATIGVCVPEPEACLSASDCDTGEACVADRSGPTLGLFCGNPVGGGTVGATCAADGDCASNLCLRGVCTDPCERPDDCPTADGFTCDSADIPLDDGSTVTGNVCQPIPPDSCLSDFDCTAGGERCVAQKSNTDLGFVCGAPNAGGREIGENCAADLDCAQNLCVTGQCAAPCQNDSRDCPADNACTTVDVDLGNGLTDTASLCEAPVECQEDDACRVSEVCFIRKDTSELFLFCTDPNFGGADLGEPCSDDVDCASNLCFEGRFRDVCTEACVDDNDCGAPGYECTTQSVPAQDGTGVDIGVCTPVPPSPCDEQSDCGNGTSCAVVPNVAGNALESVCIPTSGSNNGVACTTNDDCGSRVCLNGACAAPCQTANQCTANQICRDNTINSGGLSGSFQVCETPPDVICDSSADCSATNRVCGTIRINSANTAVETACRFPNTGQGNLGDPCADDMACFHNVCLGDATAGAAECSVVCESDSDCGAGQTCAGLGFNPGPTTVPLCITGCVDDASCVDSDFPNRVCSILIDTKDPAARVAQVCTAPSGTTDLGGPCSNSGECISGLCLTTTITNGTTCTNDAGCNQAAGEFCSSGECATAEQACTRVCDDAGDCASSMFAGNALTSCSPNTTVNLPGGGTQNISTCAQ